MRFKKTVLVFVLTATAVLSAAGNGYKLFQQGLAKERAEADLRGAIKIYEQVVQQSAADRKLAAQALFRMGECHRALGDSEARKAYERIVSDYADQKEVVAEAQARLTTSRPAAEHGGVLSMRQVWSGPPIDGTVSADGKFVTFTDWGAGGELAVRNLVAGTTRLLTKRGGKSHSYSDGSVISPDGRHVAYLWAETSDEDESEFQVRIVPIDGDAVPRIVHRNANYLFVRSWTPDGQSLLVTRSLDDGTWQIAILSLKDGSVKQLKSLQWGKIGASISPDGRYVAYDAPAGEGPARDIFVLATDGSHEATVVQHPANDHSSVWAPDGLRILFVSDRTGTPSLWSVAVNDGKPAGGAELVKSDIGSIVPLGMTRGGALYYRVSERLRRNVYRAELGDDGTIIGTPTVVTDRFVNSNWGATLSPNGEQVAFYSNRPEATLVIRSLQTRQEQVFPLDIEIDGLYFSGPGWLPDGHAVLVAATENQRHGVLLYRVDLATGNAEEVGKDIRAFRESPDGKAVFYVKENSTRLVQFDLATRRETLLKEVTGRHEHIANPAISPDGRQIAYLQQSETEMFLAITALAGGEPRVVFRYSRLNGPSRFNTLKWSPDQHQLLFVKEEDHGSSIWRVPVDGGGKAERVGVSMDARIKAPQIHPDGRSIFFTAVEADTDQIWALENFLPTLTARK